MTLLERLSSMCMKVSLGVSMLEEAVDFGVGWGRDLSCCRPEVLFACMPGDTESALRRVRIDGALASDDKTGRRSSFSKLNFPHNNPVTLRKRYSIFWIFLLVKN